MRILYCSNLCSENMLDSIFKSSERKPLLSIQKFHKLFVEGIKTTGNEIIVLSSIPVSSENNKQKFWFKKPEVYNGIKYIYIPFINIPFIRQFFLGLFSFVQTSLWCLKGEKEKSFIICDVLNVSISVPGLLSAKMLGVKSCGIVTDVPDMLQKYEKQEKDSLLGKWAISVATFFMKSYNSYVLLTEQMNKLVNPSQKPYLIMEGLVDIKMGEIQNSLTSKASKRIIIYAGGL